MHLHHAVPPYVPRQPKTYVHQCVDVSAGKMNIDEHKSSVVGEHMVEQHGEDAKNIEKSFKVLRKCRGKYECLLYEMLFIKELKPSLNKQSDSIRSKLFT